MVLERLCIVALVGLTVSMITLIIWNINCRERTSSNWETFTSLLHLQVIKCLEVDNCVNPVVALVKVNEARACTELLCRQAGGETELQRISGVDVQRLTNTMTLQERKIRAHPMFEHPLQSLASEQ